MKCLKEPLARLANKSDGCKGTFFEGRFKSVAVLDEKSLLTVCAYIDLNPVAAGIAETPEESLHTSIKERVDHVACQRRIDDLRVAKQGSVAAIKSAWRLEEDLWLIPIEDRRAIDSKREGMLSGFTLGNYVMLVEYTGRIVRNGKASISSELADIFDRIGTTAQYWQSRIKKMTRSRWFGSFIASNCQLLRETANRYSGAKAIRDFAKGIGADAKTDPIDAQAISQYAAVVNPQPTAMKSGHEQKHWALVARRNQLLELINQRRFPQAEIDSHFC